MQKPTIEQGKNIKNLGTVSAIRDGVIFITKGKKLLTTASVFDAERFISSGTWVII